MNKQDKRIILIAVLCQFIISFLSNMITILLSEISQEFNISYEMVNWISISFYVAIVTVTIPIANIVSNWEMKKLYESKSVYPHSRVIAVMIFV